MTLTQRPMARRAFLGALAAVLVGCTSKSRRVEAAAKSLAALEARIGGRVGVHVMRSDGSVLLSHREHERFAMCSTFKWVLAAAILDQCDRGQLALSDKIEFSNRDLLEYAPVAKTFVDRGYMTVQELSEAAVTLSDNVAANLLLTRIGGPAGLTRFLRQHDDTVTRLDRDEPMLNTNLPDDPRDTTSPAAMTSNLAKLLTTPMLAPKSRELLIGWMLETRTGKDRIRKGLPNTWRCGDKTGSCGQRGAVNDVAIAWPPRGLPILAAVYLSDSSAPVSTLIAAHAEIGQLMATRADSP